MYWVGKEEYELSPAQFLFPILTNLMAWKHFSFPFQKDRKGLAPWVQDTEKSTPETFPSSQTQLGSFIMK